jgi:Kinesin motor domain
MASKGQGSGYQQKYQRLPKRPDASSKTLKHNPAGPRTTNHDDSDYHLNEHVSYNQSESGIGMDQGFTAPPQLHSMNVGPPMNGQVTFGDADAAGEFVQVVCRIRPMLQFELSRGDDHCVQVLDTQNLQLNKGAGVKAFRFNRIVDESASQSDVFHQCNVAKLLNSALDGYSATLFAYGQTGSGKTYT